MILHLLRNIKTGKLVEIPDLATEQIQLIHGKADASAKRLKEMFKEENEK